jgi:glutamate synthase (ferredoxin)
MNSISSLFATHPYLATLTLILVLVAGVAVYDIFFQRRLAVLHNFPIIGHLRYFLTSIGPELRQYLFAHDKEEQPFNRSEREWIETSAKNVNNTVGFGTSEVIYSIGYPILKNAAIPSAGLDTYYSTGEPIRVPCLKTIGLSHNRARPYHPMSIVNLSAMSFGALGSNAIRAFNGGAALAGCWHNTGEGGVTEYHAGSADLVWQIGTGYFGCRDEQGGFSLERFREKITAFPQIRMIEIKLSQGAKPGRGGIVPGAKVTSEIAAIRGVLEGKDCISPNSHSAFKDAEGLIGFVEELAAASGLPVGIKVAIGKTDFFDELAVRMAATHHGPDFITIDGGEGGTGAAPLSFVDHVSLPFKIGFARVYKIFQQHGIAGDIVWIGSGKLGFPDRAIVALAMGCDLINLAREAMLSIGCIQSQKCHTGHCPTGITTQNRWLQAGLDVETKAKYFANYINNCRKELLALSQAAGYSHPAQFDGNDIEFATGANQFTSLERITGYRKDPVIDLSAVQTVGKRRDAA